MRTLFPAAGLVLGLGTGGFIDGIVLHQLLEWHHMLSGWYPLTNDHHMKLNMLGDALFHLLCLIMVLAGIGLLVRAATTVPAHRGRRLAGWMLAGWGWFKVVEGTVDHLVLGVHHVHSGPDQLGYDLGFLLFGVILIVAGTLLGRARAGFTAVSSRSN
jgi:uncharacterized membrane protein